MRSDEKRDEKDCLKEKMNKTQEKRNKRKRRKKI